MTKSPNMRHSKPHRDPVTIDLKAENTGKDKPADTSRPAAATPGVAATAKPIDDKPATAATAKPADKPADANPAQTAAGDAKTTDQKPVDSKPAEAPKSAASAAPKPAAAPAPAQRGSVSAIGAGIIGAVVALAAGAGLQFAGILPLAGQSSAITALESEISSLKSQIGSLSAPADTSRLDALEQQIRQANDAISAGGSVPAELEQRLKGLESSLADAVTAMGSGTGAAPVDLAPVTQRLDAVESAASSAAETARAAATAVEDAGRRIATIETSLGEISAKVADQAEQPKAALAIAASALKAAVERGEAFTTELDTFAAISPATPEIEQLRQMAQSGVASRASIEAAFPDAAAAMVAAGRPQDPNAGFFDKLMSSAQSLVEVRPVGMVEGDGAAEIVARMEVHLKAGDYAAAVAEYDKLPEASKVAGAAFVDRVKARLAADAMVDTILASALKA